MSSTNGRPPVNRDDPRYRDDYDPTIGALNKIRGAILDLRADITTLHGLALSTLSEHNRVLANVGLVLAGRASEEHLKALDQVSCAGVTNDTARNIFAAIREAEQAQQNDDAHSSATQPRRERNDRNNSPTGRNAYSTTHR